jgi:RHS repeat-associated protein
MPTLQKIKLFYDPLGNVIRTVNPDNTEQWVIHGKPHALSSVEVKNHWSFNGYDPTPWESYTYDANDLATKTGHLATGHEFTPASAYIDPLGRPVKSIARLGTAPTDEVITRQQYDIQGNVLSVTDALNRIVFRHKYGIGKQLLWKEHIDSGISTLVADATGKPITAKDAREAQVLTSYDALSRPVKVWAKEDPLDSYTLRQVSKYAENELGIAAAKDKNIVGQLYQHFDEAGLNQIEQCDYKGNPLEKVKQVISDATLLAAGTTSYTVDWTNNPSILDSTEYRTSIEYDALNRATQMIYPKDIENKRKVVIPKYNNAGTLEGISIRDDIGGTETSYVKHIAYNAKGQRILVAYNNTVMTRYSYDPKTFHLKRQRSETYTKTGWTYTSGGSVKQDTAYSYDLVGNIIGTKDNVTGCGIGGVNHLDKEYVFDALYRLLSATGRENSPTATPFWNDSYRSADNASTSFYRQNYSYDKVGNILSLQHIGNNNFTRNFNYIGSVKNLQSIGVGGTTLAYQYDANGNQIAEGSSRIMEWDVFNRMKSFRIEASGTISQFSHYLYDATGMRVKKLTIKGTSHISTTYIDGVFEYLTDGTEEQNIIHLNDGANQMAEVRVGNDMGDTTPAIKYIVSDYLGSVGLQLENNGAFISSEEYYPFGEVSYGSYEKKRYRFCGKERDDESGYHYYGARYYATWMCRFISVDPLAGKSPYQTSYHYCSNNPVNRVDPSGMTDTPIESSNPTSKSDSIKGNGPNNELKEVVVTASRKPKEGAQSKNVTQPQKPSAKTKTEPKLDKLNYSWASSSGSETKTKQADGNYSVSTEPTSLYEIMKNLPVKQLKDGYGNPEYHQYYLEATSTKAQFERLKAAYTSDPGLVQDNTFANYTPLENPNDQDNKLAVGDGMIIDIRGPLNGLVRFTSVSVSENNFSITAVTLDVKDPIPTSFLESNYSHPDAGFITFAGSFDPKTNTLVFTITNITTLGNWASALAGPILSRPMQEMQWKIVLDNAQNYLGLTTNQIKSKFHNNGKSIEKLPFGYAYKWMHHSSWY